MDPRCSTCASVLFFYLRRGHSASPSCPRRRSPCFCTGSLSLLSFVCWFLLAFVLLVRCPWLLPRLFCCWFVAFVVCCPARWSIRSCPVPCLFPRLVLCVLCCCVVVVGCFCLASSFLPPPLPASLSLVLLLLCFACCPALLRRFAFGPRCPSCFVHRLPYGLSSHMHTARMHT